MTPLAWIARWGALRGSGTINRFGRPTWCANGPPGWSGGNWTRQHPFCAIACTQVEPERGCAGHGLTLGLILAAVVHSAAVQDRDGGDEVLLKMVGCFG